MKTKYFLIFRKYVKLLVEIRKDNLYEKEKQIYS